MQEATRNVARPSRRQFAWTGVLSLAWLLSSCASTGRLPSLSSGGDGERPVYVVMAGKTPFYLKGPTKGKFGSETYPYIYLPKGTTVSMLKNADPFSQISLVNGMTGWVPILNLAPQMASDGGGGSTAAPVRGPSHIPPGAAAGGPHPDNTVTLPSYD